MPIIKSAKKRVRQSVGRRERNLATRRNVKDARKALVAARAGSNKKKIAEATSALQSALDTAVKKNVMHKNKAARILSRALKSDVQKTKTPAKKAATNAKKKAPAKKAKKPAAKKTPAKKT